MLSSPLQTRFRSGSSAFTLRLNHLPPADQTPGDAANIHSPDHSTKGTPLGGRASEDAHYASLRLLVSAGVQRLFHPPPGVLFTFPSRYWFTIGGQEYSRLGGWSPQLPTGFLVPRGTQGHRSATALDMSATGLSPAPVGLPRPFAYVQPRHGDLLQGPAMPYNPSAHLLAQASLVWAPARFARHYYGPLHAQDSRPVRGSRSCERLLLILLPRGTEMFQFPRCPPAVLPRWSRPITDEGLPHSDSVGSSLACSSPTTFRRAPRPSSAPGP